MRTKNYPVLCTALLLLLTGCSFERHVRLSTRLPIRPAVEQLPLRIGVHYSEEFIESTKKLEVIGCGPNGRRDPSGIFFIFPIGIASRDLFDQVVASMFASVTHVAGLSQPPHQPSAIAGLLEPLIESFTWELECTDNYLSDGKYAAVIEYVVNLYEPDGQLVKSFRVQGAGFETPRLCFRDCRDSFAADQAMLDAMAYFMVEFRKQPEINRWISHHNTSGDGP
jgi:hypothetical protein